MNAAVGGSQLHVFIALVHGKTTQLAGIRGFDRNRGGGHFTTPWRAQCAKVSDEIPKRLIAELYVGHAAIRKTIADHSGYLRVSSSGDSGHNAGSELSAISILTVTHRAACFEDLFTRSLRLGK